MHNIDFKRLAKELRLVAANPNLCETARYAVENILINLRDSRISTLRGNGLVAAEADGTPSSTIRLGVEDAFAIALKAVADELDGDGRVFEDPDPTISIPVLKDIE